MLRQMLFADTLHYELSMQIFKVYVKFSHDYKLNFLYVKHHLHALKRPMPAAC